MRSDFNDLRFTGLDGKTQLSYWIENKTDGVSANIWVRMPTIPLGGSIMYMYYGNSSAKAGSNMHNAFEFFDDFSDDSGLWNLTKGGDGGTTLTEGNAMVYAGSSSGNYGKFVTKQSYPVVNTSIMTSYRLFVRAVFIRFPKCAYALSSAYISPVSNTWSIRSYGYTPMPNHTQETCFSIGTYKDGVRRPCGSWGPYINAKINTTESSFYAYKNNVHVYTGNLSSKTPSPYSLLSVGEDYSFLDVLHMQVDYFIMRKYVNPEPFVVFGDAQNITSSNSGPWEWYCLSGDFSTKCSSQAAGIDGKCGPAAKSYASEETVFVQPFCNVGNNSPTTIKFPEPGQSVSWTCQGSNGGKSETCNARRDMLEFDSKMISHTIPASMLPEEVFKNVTVTMQNTGSVTWNRSSGIKLGASGDATLFGPMRIELPAGTSVATGGQYVFKFDIKAPKNPKNYSIQYKMVKE